MTTHNYRGYSFTVHGDKATIKTNKGIETLPIADVLRFIDAAWNKFERIRDEATAGRAAIVKEALAVAVNSWEYDGEDEKAKAAAALHDHLEAVEVAAEGASDDEAPRIAAEYLEAITEIMLTPAEKWTDDEVLDAIALQIEARKAGGVPNVNVWNRSSRAENPDFIAGACYVVEYVENELGIDLGETELAEYREENQE